MTSIDARLDMARDTPMDVIVHRLGLSDLKRVTAQELAGPCPICGGKDRFSINLHRKLWNCRRCGVSVGADGVGLVRHVLGMDFPSALAWLVGDAVAEISPEEAKRREELRAKDKADREARSLREREKSILAAQAIWREGRPIDGTQACGYFAARGLSDVISSRSWPVLRFHPRLPYTVPDSASGWRTIHEGPALLAACQAPNGRLTAVHRTWIDLGQPKGKARIAHEGVDLPAKKILGSKKGCAIRLSHHAAPWPSMLVMGEGIETTLTAMLAGVWPEAGYWAGIDLGNMGGRRLLGKGLKFAGMPDLDDQEAFLPPPALSRLVFLQDGDSDPKLTRAKLLAGLFRAKHHNPKLITAIANAGAGRDFNDILGGHSHDRR